MPNDDPARLCCLACERHDVEEINAALRAGEGAGIISQRLGLSYKVAMLHRSRCLGIPNNWEDPEWGVVYFIQEKGGGPIKIGTTKDPEARMSGLQTGNPRELILLTTIPGGPKVEARLHARFAAHRIRSTEWFHPHPELLAYIEGATAASSGANRLVHELLEELRTLKHQKTDLIGRLIMYHLIRSHDTAAFWQMEREARTSLAVESEDDPEAFNRRHDQAYEEVTKPGPLPLTDVQRLKIYVGVQLRRAMARFQDPPAKR